MAIKVSILSQDRLMTWHDSKVISKSSSTSEGCIMMIETWYHYAINRILIVTFEATLNFVTVIVRNRGIILKKEMRKQDDKWTSEQQRNKILF